MRRLSPVTLTFVVSLSSAVAFESSSILVIKNNSELPDHIKAPHSGLSLIADYDARRDILTPVYLINRSGKDIRLNSRDDDPFVRLEYQDAKGLWKRATPEWRSWCGNSSQARTLPSDCFIIIAGFQPGEGDPAPIRFRFNESLPGLISNVSRGFIDRKLVQMAEIDARALQSADFALVSAVARGKRPVPKSEHFANDSRVHAIIQLGSGRFNLGKAQNVLREIATSKDEPYAGLAKALLGGIENAKGSSR